jgi:hypothetical protein
MSPTGVNLPTDGAETDQVLARFGFTPEEQHDLPRLLAWIQGEQFGTRPDPQLAIDDFVRVLREVETEEGSEAAVDFAAPYVEHMGWEYASWESRESGEVIEMIPFDLRETHRRVMGLGRIVPVASIRPRTRTRERRRRTVSRGPRRSRAPGDPDPDPADLARLAVAGGVRVSVRLVRSGDSFAFAFRCDHCDRPEIVALLIPGGWNATRDDDDVLRHTCGCCRFDRIAAELGWEVAE